MFSVALDWLSSPLLRTYVRYPSFGSFSSPYDHSIDRILDLLNTSFHDLHFPVQISLQW